MAATAPTRADPLGPAPGITARPRTPWNRLAAERVRLVRLQPMPPADAGRAPIPPRPCPALPPPGLPGGSAPPRQPAPAPGITPAQRPAARGPPPAALEGRPGTMRR